MLPVMSEVTPAVLERVAAADSFAEAAKALVDWARDLTGCEAAMLRFREGDDGQGSWIPALFDEGFGERFRRDEILIGAEECVCGSVCGGRFQTDQPFFTEAGSFSWGRLQTIARDFSLDVVDGLRGRCMLEGFESVVVLPMGGSPPQEAQDPSGTSEPPLPVGVLHLADHAPDKFAPHLAILESVCRAAGPILSRFPAEERQRSLIAAVEAALVPKAVPEVESLDLAVSYTSATKMAHVGGDFYDIIEFEDGQVLLFVGDYCGKGIAAAGMAARARHVIAGLARDDQTLAELLSAAEEALGDFLPEGRFVTLAACRYSPGGKLECALAGHPWPLALEGADRLSELSLPSNLPLGCVIGTGIFRQGEVALREDQTLVLYTDGITEARRDGEMFGVEGIAEVWKRIAPCTLDELASDLCAASAEFHAVGLPSDDRLVLAARPVAGRANRDS